MIGRKQCPECAESIRKEARVCRYCGFRFPEEQELEGTRPEQPNSALRWAFAGVAAVVLIAAVIFGRSLSKDVEATSPPPRPIASSAVPASEQPMRPLADPIPLGTTFEWTAETAPDVVERQVGSLLVRITKRTEDEYVVPVLDISAAGQSVRLEGELVSPSYGHKISAIQNNRGGSPIVMLQSFSGGAHCCNHVQLAGISGGKLMTVDLGSWDGDEIALPTDISNDGVADFVVSDDRFLYAFAPYAMSYAPPKVLNVLGGKVRDVSSRPAFRGVFLKAIENSRSTCLTDEDGLSRNGACAAYVASAARVGRLDQAWAEMVSAYVAAVDWELPTGCLIETEATCPAESEIHFKSYPEALLHFLKEAGYASTAWSPNAQQSDDPLEITEPETVGI